MLLNNVTELYQKFIQMLKIISGKPFINVIDVKNKWLPWQCSFKDVRANCHVKVHPYYAHDSYSNDTKSWAEHVWQNRFLCRYKAGGCCSYCKDLTLLHAQFIWSFFPFAFFFNDSLHSVKKSLCLTLKVEILSSFFPHDIKFC